MHSPHIEWCIGKCLGLSTVFLKITYGTSSLSLSSSYLDFRDILDFFPCLCPNHALVAMRGIKQKNKIRGTTLVADISLDLPKMAM